MKKKIVIITVAVILLISLIVGLTMCSQPPKYEEVEQRFKELVLASQDVNALLFGKGLSVDERIYSPWDNMEKYERRDENGEVMMGSNGKPLYGYYYYTEDENYGRIIAYRNGYTSPVEYLQVLEIEDTERELRFFNEEKGWYYYDTDYTPPEVKRYYSSSDPENYDYVSDDSGYVSIDQIKLAAEKVYSKDYLEDSVYASLFTGIVMTDEGENLAGLTARYIEYLPPDSSTSQTFLMMSNTYKPLITEKRIFDFSTARVVRPGNRNLVNIMIETYLASSPENRVTVRVTMVMQDGQWYLDSPTY